MNDEEVSHLTEQWALEFGIRDAKEQIKMNKFHLKNLLAFNLDENDKWNDCLRVRI